jgi:hypothetical protein
MIDALTRAIAGLPVPDRHRAALERLDLVDVATGGKRYACLFAYDDDVARAIARWLAPRVRVAGLACAVRSLPDDRAALLGRRAPAFVVAGFRAAARPLATVWTWRRADRPPPRVVRKRDLARLLGYPACCARADERARATLVIAEARGLVRATGARTAREVRDALLADVPYAFVEPALAASRPARARRFPHVTFVPCPRCARRGARSAAGREEARRRSLAEQALHRMR